MSRKVYFGWDKSGSWPVFRLFGRKIFHKKYPSYLLRQDIAGLTTSFLTEQSKLSGIITELEKLKYINIPAAVNHPAVFTKYKGCHAGQDVVVVGTGPTLDAYTPLPGAVHIGVNRAFMQPQLALDYLVIQDRLNIPDADIINYRPGACRKLFGMHYLVPPYSEQMVQACGAERYYFDASDPLHPDKHFPADIAHQPLMVFASTIFVAVQLALWTHPRRLYIVGCDCSLNGYCHAAETGGKQELLLDPMLAGWRKLRDFADNFYPDVDIISVNPVGLKGIFRDMTMSNGKLQDITPES